MDRINKIYRSGAEGRQGDFDRRNMKADEGDLFGQVTRVLSRLFLKERSFQPRSGCKTLSHPPTRGRVYLRKSLRVGVSGEKVDFLQGRGNGLGVGGYRAMNRRATCCPGRGGSA